MYRSHSPAVNWLGSEPKPNQRRSKFGVEGLASAHTIIVPGIADPSVPRFARPPHRARGLRRYAAAHLLLATAGPLDGLRATTHWLGASEPVRCFPGMSVGANVLFIDNGRILTSQEHWRAITVHPA